MTASRVGYVYDSGLADYIPFTGPPASLPSGMVTMTAANAAPSGWLLCNGSAISRTTYADLFTAIGTTYGTGDGSTTFNLPDLRGRVVVGADSSQTEFDVLGETGGAKTVTLTTAQLPSHTHDWSGTTSNGGYHGHGGDYLGGASYRIYGGTFGADGNHYHATNTAGDASSYLSGTTVNMRYTGSSTLDTGWGGAHQHSSYVDYVLSGDHNHSVGGMTTPTGSGTAVNNLQPYIVLNYIIKH